MVIEKWIDRNKSASGQVKVRPGKNKKTRNNKKIQINLALNYGSKAELINTINFYLQESIENKMSKKIILKKRLKKFTSFYHASKLRNNILT